MAQLEMTMIEQWIKWEPLLGLTETYCIDSICDSSDGFTIILSEEKDENKKIVMKFGYSVGSHRQTNEDLSSFVINELCKTYGENFYVNSSFFRVENSNYLKWLSEQSGAISDELQYKHFVIMTSDVILDIAARFEPTIEWVTK